jgi:hypothetical protein
MNTKLSIFKKAMRNYRERDMGKGVHHGSAFCHAAEDGISSGSDLGTAEFRRITT